MTRSLLGLLLLHACAGPSAPTVSAPPAASMTIPSPVPSASPASASSESPVGSSAPAPPSSSAAAPAAQPIDDNFGGISSAGTKPADVDAGALSPVRVFVGDQYAAKLAEFIRRRMPKSPGRALVVFQVSVSKNMRIWHVRSTPIRPSGDDAYDSAVRAALEKLIDDKVALPEPPPEIADLFRARTINLSIGGPVGP